MPGSTPVFGFPYPVASDPVDPNAFANLMYAIDTAMSSIATERQAMLLKPMLGLGAFHSTSVAAGVEQTLTWDSIFYDSSGMAPAVGGTDIVVTVPGVYTIDPSDFQIQGYTTLGNWLASIFVNGNRLAADKKPATTLSTSLNSPVTSFPFVWPLYIGDIVQLKWQFSGTGSANFVACQNFSMQLLCPLS